MVSIRMRARIAGWVYLACAGLGITSYFIIGPKFKVSGDAAETAHRIMAGESLYRLDLIVGFLSVLAFFAAVWLLYELFRDVDGSLSRIMLLLVTVAVGAQVALIVLGVAPLILLGGSSVARGLTRPQLESLASVFLKLRGSGETIVSAFWGLWLFPFGVLVIKSRWFPRILGWLLFAAGVAYPVVSFATIGWPHAEPTVSRLMTPLYQGELPIVLWLAIMGAREPKPKPQPA